MTLAETERDVWERASKVRSEAKEPVSYEVSLRRDEVMSETTDDKHQGVYLCKGVAPEMLDDLAGVAEDFRQGGFPCAIATSADIAKGRIGEIRMWLKERYGPRYAQWLLVPVHGADSQNPQMALLWGFKDKDHMFEFKINWC
ncbi:MAG: hypothetical protein J0J10_20025 [Bosea sp.]|uniref:hypothetical protein n=1 Tax=Bosea sp. (in: a-proteobacteria) TaxID=1871050 RepID=UPI001AD0B91C|nr:hypothetical protein [Bosea sp. (in: a-proteobacteria)]MBN9471060.1 hypothetical protein [Bosea sp. (in: a-proteobacteria)]